MKIKAEEAMNKKNILYNTLLQVSQLLFPLITFPYAARVLQPTSIGAVSFASNFTQYFLTFALLGIPIYGIREIAKVHDDEILLKKTFSELFYFNLITTAIISFLFLLTIIIVPILKSDLTLFLIGFGIIWANLFFIEWYFNGSQEFKYITIRSLIIRSFSVILIFTLIKKPEDKNLYYLIELVVLVLSSACNFSKARHLLTFRLNTLNLRKHITPILTLFSLSVMITIYVYANSIILGFYRAKDEVAYYTTSEKISKLSIAFVKTAGIVLLPQLSILLNKKSEIHFKQAISLLNKSFYYTTFLSIPISFGVFVFSRELIQIIAGQDYLNANISLKILSPLPILLGLAFIYSRQILFPLGKERQMFKLSIWGMIFNVLTNIFLIPKYGYIGSSISYLLTELLMLLLVYFESIKHLKLNINIQEPIINTLICLSFFPIHNIIYHFNSKPFIVLMIGIVLCTGIYAVLQLRVLKNKIAIEIYNFAVLKILKK